MAETRKKGRWTAKMERGEAKGESAEQKKQELKMKVKKLKKGGIQVGKRSGPSTPSPIWRLEFTSLNRPIVQEFLDPNNIPTTTTVSARKLCATLWEIHPQPHHHHTSLAKMPNPKSSHFNHNSRPFNLPNYVRHPPTCSPHPHPRQVLLLFWHRHKHTYIKLVLAGFLFFFFFLSFGY